ncbi:hypothetical protein NKH18_23715 [Streptomyces sp. M10(2022)]
MAVTAPLLAHKINSPADIAPQDVHEGSPASSRYRKARRAT